MFYLHLHLRSAPKRLLRYLVISLGCFIAAASINLFLVPSHLLTGGATGIAIIVYFLTNLPIGAQTMAYNIPLLFAAYKLLGKGYTVDVIIGTAIFSFMLDALRFLNSYAPLNDLMLAAIFGGVFNGIGYGIVFRMNGSTGGFDIIGAIVKKYYSFQMGGVIFGFNCMVMLVAGFLFGATPAMFTLVCMYVTSQVTDKVIAGFNSRKVVLIISPHTRAIADEIINEVGRGVTFLHGQGAFTRMERNVIFVVVSLTQIAKIKFLANLIDPHAFMIVLPASEVMGRGFSEPTAAKAALSDKQHEKGV